MAIIRWRRIGKPEVIAEGFGKRFVRQRFIDHHSEPTDFFFLDQEPWSVVLPITSDGNVILVRHYKQGADIVIEELPGGTADFRGERPEAIMRREFREETGYEPGEVIALGSGWINSRNSTTPFYCFLARECRKVGPAHLDRSEQEEVIEMPLGEWVGLMLKGEWVQWDAYVTMIRALPHLGIDLAPAFGK